MEDKKIMLFEKNVWDWIDPEDMWVLNKFQLSRMLGYNCGPMEIFMVKEPLPINFKLGKKYIRRPVISPNGCGLYSHDEFIETSKQAREFFSVPHPGHFWCEYFEGRHYSVDYKDGKQFLNVEGFNPHNTRTAYRCNKWEAWKKTDKKIPLPKIVKELVKKYVWINCEFIDDKLIEVHLRPNEDFHFFMEDKIPDIMIPLWSGTNIDKKYLDEYKTIEFVLNPEINDRIGMLYGWK